VLAPWFVPLFLLFDASRLPSLPARIAFIAIAAAGAGLRVWCTGFRTWAYRSSGARHLMTAGPYAIARHPIYVANVLIAMPFFLASGLWWLSLAFAAWYGLTHLAIVIREDEILRDRYGEEWVRYAGQVRRFLPRITPYAPRRGDFSWEPVRKGMELPKAAAFLALLVLGTVLLPDLWTHAARFLRDRLF
jgi:protein-S-isoprenylcysteine O-methyltransferase Ste14